MNTRHFSITKSLAVVTITCLLATGCNSVGDQPDDRNRLVDACLNYWFLNREADMDTQTAFEMRSHVKRNCEQRADQVLAEARSQDAGEIAQTSSP